MKRFDGELLKRIRVQRGLSMSALGKGIGAVTPTVQEYENGRCVPNAEKLARICDVLQLGMVEICGLLRVVPRGVTRRTLECFLRLCESRQLSASAVIGSMIRGYVYEWEQVGDEYGDVVEGVGEKPRAVAGGRKARLDLPAPPLERTAAPADGRPRVERLGTG